MRCWFCNKDAVTIGYGFAICGGRPDGEVNCSEVAQGLFERVVFEQAERAQRAYGPMCEPEDA